LHPQPECLVPILRHDNRLSGLIVLGPRLSEEPYSRKTTLARFHRQQAGIALENIHPRKKWRSAMEATAGVARDMEIAREVQARLFPASDAPLQTLDYAGACIQARVVGGDYYDFLDLGPGRLGVVLADISGKGIAPLCSCQSSGQSAGSQYAVALEDPHRLLQSVNRLFYRKHARRSLRHALLCRLRRRHALPALRQLWAQSSALVTRQWRTGTASRYRHRAGPLQGMECGIEEISLRPGDTLLAYTDGVSEAPNSREKSSEKPALRKSSARIITSPSRLFCPHP